MPGFSSSARRVRRSAGRAWSTQLSPNCTRSLYSAALVAATAACTGSSASRPRAGCSAPSCSPIPPCNQWPVWHEAYPAHCKGTCTVPDASARCGQRLQHHSDMATSSCMFDVQAAPPAGAYWRRCLHGAAGSPQAWQTGKPAASGDATAPCALQRRRVEGWHVARRSALLRPAAPHVSLALHRSTHALPLGQPGTTRCRGLAPHASPGRVQQGLMAGHVSHAQAAHRDALHVQLVCLAARCRVP